MALTLSPLRRRIFFWTLIVALFPLVVMAVQGYRGARQALGESVMERLRAVAMVPRGLVVSGHVYDISTGRLTQVVEAARLG